MCSRNCYRQIEIPHNLAQKLGTAELRNILIRSGNPLGIVLVNGCRIYEQIDIIAHIGSALPDIYSHALIPESFSNLTFLHIRA